MLWDFVCDGVADAVGEGRNGTIAMPRNGAAAVVAPIRVAVVPLVRSR